MVGCAQTCLRVMLALFYEIQPYSRPQADASEVIALVPHFGGPNDNVFKHAVHFLPNTLAHRNYSRIHLKTPFSTHIVSKQLRGMWLKHYLK